MTTQVRPTRCQADNNAGFNKVVLSEWPIVCIFHVGPVTITRPIRGQIDECKLTNQRVVDIYLLLLTEASIDDLLCIMSVLSNAFVQNTFIVFI